MNVGYDTDFENVKKQALLDLMKGMPLQLLQVAYSYAKIYVELGVDITKTWDTAIQNADVLEKAYKKGYYEGLERARTEQVT